MTSLLPWLAALRPRQWAKNVLVFAALVFALGDRAQSIDLLPALLLSTLAFLAFCLISSSVYLFNDIRDRDHDRHHPFKRHRPIAAGTVPVPGAVLLGLTLLLAGLLIGYSVSKPFLGILLLYIAIQIAYTWKLKHIALLDIFIIAAGFVLRAMSGGLAIHVVISPWLLLCTLLLALFLALCKRRQEKIVSEGDHRQSRTSLLAYDARLLDQLITMTGTAAMVSYALYTFAPETVAKFGSHRLGLTIPFVMFGIFRYMDLVYRHNQGERPEKVLMTDIPLITTLLLYGLTALLLILAPTAF
ncbi:MAG TPA: decaprenyl-phosphate phosphoribosyltransferase [Kiritimatiellia bacterium]|nr:decaprenyl-phosphate phosphoribosyltransferase [Kiritimatiellia bacterium]